VKTFEVGRWPLAEQGLLRHEHETIHDRSLTDPGPHVRGLRRVRAPSLFVRADAADAMAIGSETHSIAFDDGYFSVSLGETTPLDTR